MTDMLTKLKRDWFVVWQRTEEKFAACTPTPSNRTRAAAVVLELWIGGHTPGWPGLTSVDIQECLNEIYEGRCSARVLKDGDVALITYKKKSR